MPEEKKTVLVVDDLPENIGVLSTVLGGMYRVKAATNGQKALQICAADPPPDLVLLDVVMPEMDGLEVCRRLKADGRTAGIPVVFVTGIEEETGKEAARSAGAAGFLAKPIDPAATRACVAAHLGGTP
jgi:CheY-like chemotaxis protein